MRNNGPVPRSSSGSSGPIMIACRSRKVVAPTPPHIVVNVIGNVIGADEIQKVKELLTTEPTAATRM
jgi:xanthosine utilization system XapX-like protein